MNFGFSGFPIVQQYGGITQAWAASDAQYALRNQLRPDMSMAEIAAIGAIDKQLELTKQQAQLRYDYSVAQEDADRARYKKNVQRHEAHIQNGWLF